MIDTWPTYLNIVSGAGSCGHQHNKQDTAENCGANLARQNPYKEIQTLKFERKFITMKEGKPEYEVSNVVVAKFICEPGKKLDEATGQSRR